MAAPSPGAAAPPHTSSASSTTAAAAASGQASSPGACRLHEKFENYHEIIVVGAGIAGLSAAYHIMKAQNDSDVLVLEARERLGGRVLHAKLGDTQVELGARWIHGVLGNPLYEFAVSQGLVGLNDQASMQHNVVVTTERGSQIPLDLIDEVYSAYFWFSKRCEEYHLTRLKPPPEFDNSVGKHIQRDIDGYLKRYSGEEKKVRQMIFTHVKDRDACIAGADSMDTVSLEDFGAFAELPGGNVILGKGKKSFFELCLRLAEPLGSDRIKMSCRVNKIRWKMISGDLYDCDTVRVETSAGLFHCSHLIVTLPLGVLKESVDLFVPRLPSMKTQAVDRLQFATVNKLYILFNRPVLNKEIDEVLCLWEPCDTYIESEWWKKIYSFSKLSDTILCCWLSGLEAELLEHLSDDEVITRITEVLRGFLADPYVPRPVQVVCSRWKTDPYSRGSYTSISSQASQQDIDNLAKPLYTGPFQSKPKVLFAGEATHSTFYSTAHGAFISGQRCANLLTTGDPESCDFPEGWINSSSRRSSTADLSSWLKGIDIRRQIR
ncbi:peroxisomal N(1)-acetyl-spermine/spermidine oxidase-like isoform X1 [Varroa jacobsoni]|uniref:Amine oxidase domain-containing protein n=1 Tax=Varroa destructor TaxID=109461 RepID=A0A7M7KPZ1_VARDE|nr:peroxisomal N(1)-acetyl-spermine/spermidine oxidase-like [Varroa destructor]XP_022711146.1 peroxisomal N(1)-acetyl-spermine/spermidine oxidase-like isoform X1 [Varroa jacobsoni]